MLKIPFAYRRKGDALCCPKVIKWPEKLGYVEASGTRSHPALAGRNGHGRGISYILRISAGSRGISAHELNDLSNEIDASRHLA